MALHEDIRKNSLIKAASTSTPNPQFTPETAQRDINKTTGVSRKTGFSNKLKNKMTYDANNLRNKANNSAGKGLKNLSNVENRLSQQTAQANEAVKRYTGRINTSQDTDYSKYYKKNTSIQNKIDKTTGVTRTSQASMPLPKDKSIAQQAAKATADAAQKEIDAAREAKGFEDAASKKTAAAKKAEGFAQKQAERVAKRAAKVGIFRKGLGVAGKIAKIGGLPATVIESILPGGFTAEAFKSAGKKMEDRMIKRNDVRGGERTLVRDPNVNLDYPKITPDNIQSAVDNLPPTPSKDNNFPINNSQQESLLTTTSAPSYNPLLKQQQAPQPTPQPIQQPVPQPAQQPTPQPADNPAPLLPIDSAAQSNFRTDLINNTRINGDLTPRGYAEQQSRNYAENNPNRIPRLYPVQGLEQQGVRIDQNGQQQIAKFSMPKFSEADRNDPNMAGIIKSAEDKVIAQNQRLADIASGKVQGGTASVVSGTTGVRQPDGSIKYRPMAEVAAERRAAFHKGLRRQESQNTRARYDGLLNDLNNAPTKAVANRISQELTAMQPLLSSGDNGKSALNAANVGKANAATARSIAEINKINVGIEQSNQKGEVSNYKRLNVKLQGLLTSGKEGIDTKSILQAAGYPAYPTDSPEYQFLLNSFATQPNGFTPEVFDMNLKNQDFYKAAHPNG